MRSAVLAATLSTLAAPSAASDLFLAQPIDCVLNQSCFIQHFVDHDPGPGAEDFTCGGLSYDGHKGTDFALATLMDMQAGVDVLAAAPGVVTALRDAMPDTGWSDATSDDIAGQECGNGVVIDHGAGWETQYCHMARGSIAMEIGQTVSTGDVLGRVGLSGRTEFPHLHFSLRRNGEVVDPFSTETEPPCMPGPSLWQDPLPYQAGGLMDIGFADGVPDYEAVQAGTANVPGLTTQSRALVLFALAYGARPEDQLRFRILGPDDEVIDETVRLEQGYARVFRAVGKRLRLQRWPSGGYEGRVQMIRGDQIIDERALKIRLY